MKLRNRQWATRRLLTLGFGCFFFDYDLDGWPDIFVANGHIEDAIERVQQRVTLCGAAAPVPTIWAAENLQEATRSAGRRHLRRRAWLAARLTRDINNDGAPGSAGHDERRPRRLFRNAGATNHSLRVKLVGTKSNRDGIGAVVNVTAGSDAQTEMMRSGSSYLSSSELVLTFGLSAHRWIIEIQWPSGAKESISKVSPNQFITIKEGSGIVSSHPLAFAKEPA